MSARLHSPSALANPTLLFGLPSPHPASKFARPLTSALSSCTSSPSTHAHSSSINNSSFHGQHFSIPPYSSCSSGASTSVSTSSSRNGSTNSSFSAASLASRYRPTPLPSPAIGEGVESPSTHEGNTPSFEYDSTSPALELSAPLSHNNSYSSSVGASTDSSFSATQSPVHSTFDHSRASSTGSAIPPSPSPLSQDTTYQATTTTPSISSRNNRPLSINLSASSSTPPAVFTTSPLPSSTSLPSTVRPLLSRSQLSYSNKMKLLLQQKIDSVSKEVALKRAEANAKRLAEANSSHLAEETEGRHRTSGFDARREWTEGGRKEREKREKMEKAAREEASEREREREMRAVGGDWRKIGVL